jgi:hypothetical protein
MELQMNREPLDFVPLWGLFLAASVLTWLALEGGYEQLWSQAVAAGLALLGMAAVGYHAGLSATRRSPGMLGMVLAFAGVLFLIADLDRGYEGLLTVSQQPMLDLQKSMHDTKPH